MISAVGSSESLTINAEQKMESAGHKSYTASFKLTVVECAEKIGNRAAARKFVVNERCVRRWRAEKDDLEKMPKLKRAQRGGVVPWPHLEEKLESWIREQQDKALPVSTIQIRDQAKLMAEQMGISDFKGGPNWCYRFMKRKKLVVSSKSCVKDKLHSEDCKKQPLLPDVQPSVVYKSYTAGFKLTVVERAEKVGNRAASREFSVDERCVRRWRSEKEDLEKMPKFKRAQRGFSLAWFNLEENLATWVKEQQNLGLPLTMENIRAQAKSIAKQLGLTSFTGSLNWYYRFLKRKKLSVDTECTITQSLETTHIEKNSFVENSITELIQQLKLTKAQVISMAVVSFAFDCLLDNSVIGEEANTVLPSNDKNKKTFFTCMLACASNGDKLKPFIIFKLSTLWKGNYASDVIIRSNEKGWKCDKIKLEWLNEVWRKRKGAIFEPRGILIVDFMLAESLESVKQDCEKVSAQVVAIPKRLSPLNSVIDESFKREMQNRWEEWNDKINPVINDELKKVTPEEIAKWVVESWKSINISTIISGFKDATIITSESEQITENTVNLEKTTCNETVLGDNEFLKQIFISDNGESDLDRIC